MKRLYLVALAAGLITSLPASLLAQAPAAGNDTPAPAASPAPAPAATPAPAASPDTSAPADKGGKKTASKKKSSGKKMTREQEINHSIDTGTVPARYRRYVPKEYQQDIPFERR